MIDLLLLVFGKHLRFIVIKSKYRQFNLFLFSLKQNKHFFCTVSSHFITFIFFRFSSNYKIKYKICIAILEFDNRQKSNSNKIKKKINISLLDLKPNCNVYEKDFNLFAGHPLVFKPVTINIFPAIVLFEGTSLDNVASK